MRLFVTSDMHTEMGAPDSLPLPEHDVTVLAGDIGTSFEALEQAARLRDNGSFSKTIVQVAGNHEYWGQVPFNTNTDAMRLRAKQLGIHFLQNEKFVLEDGERKLIFLGGTLWTNFALYGNPLMFMNAAPDIMGDYRYTLEEAGLTLSSRTVRNEHDQTFDFIRRALLEKRGESDVVLIVSHHAPSEKSCSDPRFVDHYTNAFYASDLEHLMSMPAGPDYWFHGHVHNSNDYTVGKTRVITNPMGYPQYRNPKWNANLILEV